LITPVCDALKKLGWTVKRVRMNGPLIRAWFAPVAEYDYLRSDWPD